MIVTAVSSLQQAQEVPWPWALEERSLSDSGSLTRTTQGMPVACPVPVLLKLLVLLFLKAGYCPEQSTELTVPAKFVKASITTDGESMLNKLNFLSAGGGNTFRLLKALYDNSLIHEIRKRVLEVKLQILAKTEWQDLMHELLFRQIQADFAFLSLIYLKGQAISSSPGELKTTAK